ncbi:insulinase family protein [Bacteroidales bacterium OttesenSCG-928-I21]|nr:insulinase family protein [Bacteroidales bacterium OttesenSCG-928-I21]
MKSVFAFVFSIFISFVLFSQEQKLSSFVLENGLTVYLNEDMSIPTVLGAVVVKTGGKYDPPHATGTSHYLEHMLFKGTDKIGTTNYEEEKIFLDSIAIKYDELSEVTDEEQRKEIQKQINELSLKAGEYAIPNELDKILDMIGSTNVNAFTSNEVVAYFNMFPESQIENWLYLYSQRFTNPVFRLFQSELETVFEEKNMYADDLMTTFVEKFYAQFYKNHPYGTQTIIGSADDIKNPSLTTMQEMFNTYYVANNMALILTGSFDTEKTKVLVEKYFLDWKSGVVPEFPVYEEVDFEGIVVVKERLTPIKVGVMGFRTVSATDEDAIIFDVCQALLNNSASTGYFDKLNLNRKVLAAIGLNDIRNDHGAFAIIYVPRIIGQSLSKTRKVVHKEILKLQTGNIDTDFFEAIKLGLIKEHAKSMESSIDRGFMIAEIFVSNKTWNDIVDYPDKIQKITIEDVKRVANKYFGNNYLSYESRMGFPKKEKLKKPGFDPVIPKNSEAKSEFMKDFEKRPEPAPKPSPIEIGKHILITDINDKSKFYYSKNNINDIFNLEIKFHSGLFNDNRYTHLSDYIELIGTQKRSLNELNEELQKLGATAWVYAEDDYFIVSIDGFDKHLNKTLELVLERLKTPKANDSKLKIVKSFDTFARKYEKNNPDELSTILLNYALFGDKSKYITRLSKKEIKKIKSEELLNLLAKTLEKPYSIHYSGSLTNQEVFDIVASQVDFESIKNDEQFPVIQERKKYCENTILFLNEASAVQSKIYFFIEGNINTAEERAVSTAFTNYFGSGMSSLVFQEIREFRSLAYHSQAKYVNGKNLDSPGYFISFLGTQADKTVEAIFIVDSLIRNMPRKENRIYRLKSLSLQSINSNIPDFREASKYVENCMLRGYDSDPRLKHYDVFKNLGFEDIVNFYEKNIYEKPVVITIVGNKKQINIDELSKFGKIIELKRKQIMN